MTVTEQVRRDAERLAGLTGAYLTLDQAAAKAGLDPGQVAAIWTASGFPTPERDDPCLGDGDVEILRAISDLRLAGSLSPSSCFNSPGCVGGTCAASPMLRSVLPANKQEAAT